MRIVRHPRAGSAKTAIAIGSFDGVHLGHQAILAHVSRKARSLGLQAAVLTFEPLPREFFHPESAPPRLTSQMVSKGSITVDGVSLTLVDVETERFSVALIPHTLESTTLGLRQPGEDVNLETDILGKYIEKLLAAR